MAGTIKLDGTTFLSKSGSDFTLDVGSDGTISQGTFNGTVGSTATFPAGHVLQMKAVNIPTSGDISGGYSAGTRADYTGVSQTDITLNRNSGTHVLYCLQGGGAYANSSGRSMYTIGRRTSGSTYTGTEVELSTDTDEGNSRLYSSGAALLSPFSIACFDSASISGDYTYRFFYRGTTGVVDFQKSDRGDITVYIMEFNPS